MASGCLSVLVWFGVNLINIFYLMIIILQLKLGLCHVFNIQVLGVKQLLPAFQLECVFIRKYYT